MADLKTDLINELRNQKYYLEQSFVKTLQSPQTDYKSALDSIQSILVQIGQVNTGLALADAYLQTEEEVKASAEKQNEGAPQASEPEGDVVSQPAPQPVAGQTHAE